MALRKDLVHHDPHHPHCPPPQPPRHSIHSTGLVYTALHTTHTDGMDLMQATQHPPASRPAAPNPVPALQIIQHDDSCCPSFRNLLSSLFCRPKVPKGYIEVKDESKKLVKGNH